MSQSVIAVVDEMFFAAKIRGTGEALGIRVRFARSLEKVIEMSLKEAPGLIIADLHAKACDPFRLARELKSDGRLKTIPLLGFFSHVQTALQQQASEAGYDRILPRSAFSKNLPAILSGEV